MSESIEQGITSNEEGLYAGLAIATAGPPDQLIVSSQADLAGTYSPIASLSPEVLTRIFQFSALLEPIAVNFWKTPRAIDLGWIKVTHVCGFWRQAALGDPTLWTNPPVNIGRNWTREILARSKAVPVSIFIRKLFYWIEPANWSMDDLREVMSNHLSHLGELKFQGSLDAVPVITKLLNSSTPVLRSLDITVSEDVSEWDGPRIAISTPPPTSAVRLASQLRTIRLQGCHLSWEYPLGYALKHLTVRLPGPASRHGSVRTELTAFSPIAFENMIRSLNAMPNLETLNLGHCLPRRDPTLSSASFSQPKAHLPKLVCLVLCGHVGECHDIIQAIKIPFKAYISLSMPTTPGSRGEDCLAILPFIKAHLTGREATVLEPAQRELDISDSSGLSVCAREANPRDSDSLPPKTTLLHLNFQYDSEDHGVSLDVMRKVCDAVSLRNVETLSIKVIKFHDQGTGQTWVDYLRRYQAVQHLNATRSATVMALFRSLTLTSPSSDDLRQSIIFPKLKALFVAGGRIDALCAQALCAQFDMRRTWATEVESFEGVGCEVDLASIPLLRDSVCEYNIDSDAEGDGDGEDTEDDEGMSGEEGD
ncbi:hypothetical protein BV25DRAFT_1921762 [Artomyces pyxidatus]|uniref:Uncharacterized protein n=1 Tax=Artomyces pyxidatus TaxID=48021 RepID=A0ACB8SI23_9AGAM|nr:hypothetical protein BV25DRAFT_1921762 [Artomyces pyxidatus]